MDNQAIHFLLSAKIYFVLTKRSSLKKLVVGNDARTAAVCEISFHHDHLSLTVFLSLHPLCGGGNLLFLLSPPASAATCFCSHSKTPTQIISKYLHYAYWPVGICLVNFSFMCFSFFNKIQDCRQSPMSHARA